LRGAVTVTRAYDGARRLVREQAGSGVTTYAYDGAGRRTRMTDSSGTTMYLYDGAGRIFAIDHKETNGTVFQKAHYTYDANGNRLSFADITTTTSYTYDALDQLVGSGATAYTNDAVGNRTAEGATAYSYDAANRLTAAGGTTYTNDADGNRTQQTAGGQTTTYGWDAFGRLTGLNGAAGYVYDGDGLRRQAGTTRYVWDHQASPAQLLSDGNDHLWGATGLLAAVKADTNCVTYAFTDALGSVQAQKTSGGQTATQRYGPFGIPLGPPPAPCVTPAAGYTGVQQDAGWLVRLSARRVD
jgi:YD repeat-containing protein